MPEGATMRRRQLLRLAVATGGIAGLSACIGVYDEPIPAGGGPLPPGQHHWNDQLTTDAAGNHQLPRHHLLLYADLQVDPLGEPAVRDRLTAAFTALTAAYRWGPEGLLFTVGYSPAYFRRHYGRPPEGVDLPPPRRLSPFETPTFDQHDLLIHLASDRADAVTGAEAALRGQQATVNGREAPVAIDDLLGRIQRRTGFVGAGMPAERQSDLVGIPDDDPVPEAAPLFMGFMTGFRQNQATEAAVELTDGPFRGGTTLALANIRLSLDAWYTENSHAERVAKLFSPTHAAEGAVPGVGRALGDDNGVTPAIVDAIDADAGTVGVVGHAQKAARANRTAGGEPLTLRRHFESTDDGVASLHFPSYQREISRFEAVTEAMNGTDIAAAHPQVRQRVNNGILRYMFVRSRGNFLIPPRHQWALPTPTG
jgi:hypothetical protein